MKKNQTSFGVMNLGVDIVHIKRIKELMKDKYVLSKIFHKTELKPFTEQHLAGIFAVKECCKKALGTKIDWLDIEVKKMKSGKPLVNISEFEGKSLVSISHDGDYAFACAIFAKHKL